MRSKLVTAEPVYCLGLSSAGRLKGSSTRVSASGCVLFMLKPPQGKYIEDLMHLLFPDPHCHPCSFYNLDAGHLIHCGSPGLGAQRSHYHSATPRGSHLAAHYPHCHLSAQESWGKKDKHDSRFQATSKQFEFSKNTMQHISRQINLRIFKKGH